MPEALTRKVLFEKSMLAVLLKVHRMIEDRGEEYVTEAQFLELYNLLNDERKYEFYKDTISNVLPQLKL